MEKQGMPLVGDDGTVFTGAGLGPEITGNGAAAIGMAGIYLITAAGSPSFFPEGLGAGEVYPADGSEVLEPGDRARRILLEESADITGWKLEMSQEQVDITRLKDRYKKFRPGKRDANGTMNMIFTLGVTDREGGLVSRMMKTVVKKENAVTINEVDGKPLYFVGYTRKTDAPGETELFVFGQIYLYGVSFGGQSSQAQSFDCSFKLTGIDPVFYSVEIPLAG